MLTLSDRKEWAPPFSNSTQSFELMEQHSPGQSGAGQDADRASVNKLFAACEGLCIGTELPDDRAKSLQSPVRALGAARTSGCTVRNDLEKGFVVGGKKG